MHPWNSVSKSLSLSRASFQCNMLSNIYLRNNNHFKDKAPHPKPPVVLAIRHAQGPHEAQKVVRKWKNHCSTIQPEHTDIRDIRLGLWNSLGFWYLEVTWNVTSMACKWRFGNTMTCWISELRDRRWGPFLCLHRSFTQVIVGHEFISGV